MVSKGLRARILGYVYIKKRAMKAGGCRRHRGRQNFTQILMGYKDSRLEEVPEITFREDVTWHRMRRQTSSHVALLNAEINVCALMQTPFN